MEPARVTIQLTPADLRAFNKHCLSRGWNWRGMVLYVIAIGIIGMAFFMKDSVPNNTAHAASEPAGSGNSRLLSFLPIALFLLTLCFFFWKTLRGKGYEETNPDLMKPIVIILTAEGVHEESAIHVGTTTWAAIKSVDENAVYLFLMLAKR